MINEMSNSDNYDLGDSYQMVDLMHANTLKTRIEEYKRPRLQENETRTKVLTELTLLQKDLATEQSGKLDVVTKNFKKTKEIVQDTGEELEKFQEDNKVDNQKLICYGLVMLCVIIGIFAMNWLVSK